MHRYNVNQFIILLDLHFVEVAAQGVALFVARWLSVGFVFVPFGVELRFVDCSILSLFRGCVLGVSLTTESWTDVHWNIFVRRTLEFVFTFTELDECCWFNCYWCIESSQGGHVVFAQLVEIPEFLDGSWWYEAWRAEYCSVSDLCFFFLHFTSLAEVVVAISGLNISLTPIFDVDDFALAHPGGHHVSLVHDAAVSIADVV